MRGLSSPSRAGRYLLVKHGKTPRARCLSARPSHLRTGHAHMPLNPPPTPRPRGNVEPLSANQLSAHSEPFGLLPRLLSFVSFFSLQRVV